MQTIKLIIANKRYSSWSMRPWLALKVKGIEFDEELSTFDMATNHQHFWQFSPTKKVPVLKHGELTVWDSLSILEYIAELYPEEQLWPKDLSLRAQARSLSNEMHSGFLALRTECPMNMCRQPSKIDLSADTLTDIARIESIFSTYLSRHGGPFLFGEFGIVDAMFAPVINRIEVYQLSQDPDVMAYSQAIKNLPAWQQWDDEAHAEPWVCKNVEI